MDASLLEMIKAADAAAGNQRNSPPDGNLYVDKLKTGIAHGVGNVMDVVPRGINLLAAGYGVAGIPQLLSAATGKPAYNFQPEIQDKNVDVNTKFLKQLLGVKGLQGETTGEKLLGGLVEGIGGGITSPTGTGKVLMDLLKSAFIGGAAGGGSEIGGMATGDSAAGKIAGALLAGVAAPAALSKYPSGASSILNGNATKSAAPFVEKIVDGQVKRSVRGDPSAAENITSALELQNKLPGFSASVGEMAGNPALLDMQRRYSMSSPQNLNSEIARGKSNAAVVDQYYQSNAPAGGSPSSVRSAINQNIAKEQSTIRANELAVANKVPSTDQLALGGRMDEIANAEKVAARPAITAAYEKAFEADTRKIVDLSPVISKAEEILGTKLSQIKPETAPNTIAAIRRLKPEDVKPTGFGFTQELTAGGPGSANATLRDIDGIRKAINADISSAMASNNPVAATQLRNLGQLHKTIDETVTASGLSPVAKDSYKEALRKYREEFVPRFKEGSNKRMFQDSSLNEPKIIPDKFTSEYFKTDSQGGLTKARQFGNLFGKNNEAIQTTKSGVIDKYRDSVVDKNTGAINITSHNKFIADHKDTLSAFKKMGVNAMDDIESIGKEATKVMNAGAKLTETAKGLKHNTVDELVDSAIKSQRVMGNVMAKLDDGTKDQFRRILMDRAVSSGGAAGMSQFIADNKKVLSMALTPQHISSLEDISGALKLMERNPIKGALTTEGPDIIKNLTGISTATVWSQYRATTGGRQGIATGIFNLAAPVATKLSQKEFSGIMENALHNPDTAKHLRDFLLAQNAGQASMAGAALSKVKQGAGLLWSASGPIAKYALGTRFYPSNIARSQASLSPEVENQGQ